MPQPPSIGKIRFSIEPWNLSKSKRRMIKNKVGTRNWRSSVGDERTLGGDLGFWGSKVFWGLTVGRFVLVEVTEILPIFIYRNLWQGAR